MVWRERTRTLETASPGFQCCSHLTALWTLSTLYFLFSRHANDYIHSILVSIKSDHVYGNAWPRVWQVFSKQFPPSKHRAWYLQRLHKCWFPFTYTWSLSCEAAGWKIPRRFHPSCGLESTSQVSGALGYLISKQKDVWLIGIQIWIETHGRNAKFSTKRRPTSL